MTGISILERFLKLGKVCFRNEDFKFDVFTHGYTVLTRYKYSIPRPGEEIRFFVSIA